MVPILNKDDAKFWVSRPVLLEQKAHKSIENWMSDRSEQRPVGR